MYKVTYDFLVVHIKASQKRLGDKPKCIIRGDLDPVDYGFTLENGHLLPSTLRKTLDVHWSVVCHCGKCVCITLCKMPLSSSHGEMFQILKVPEDGNL